MKTHQSQIAILAGMFALTAPLATISVAAADSASTAAIVAGAAGIVGALIYDSNNHPYYIRNGHRYYVNNDEANQYRHQHRGTERRAYVPEQEMPVARQYQNNHNADNRHDHR